MKAKLLLKHGELTYHFMIRVAIKKYILIRMFFNVEIMALKAISSWSTGFHTRTRVLDRLVGTRPSLLEITVGPNDGPRCILSIWTLRGANAPAGAAKNCVFGFQNKDFCCQR